MNQYPPGRSARDRTIAVLSTSFGGPYFGSVLAGIGAATAAAGGRLVAIQTLDAGTFSLDLAEPPAFRHQVGFDHISAYAVLLNAVDEHYVHLLQEAGKPVVMISGSLPSVRCPIVLPDNRTGIRQAVEHLLAHGHRRIAFAGFPAQRDIEERYRTYQETLLEHGIEPDPELFFNTWNNQESGGEQAAQAMIRAALPSTAVVTGNDLNAIGLMKTLQAAGYQVPRDQAVVGFDDMDTNVYLSPTLTSVQQHPQVVGRTAVQLLIQQLAGEPVPADWVYVPTQFVARESCGCPSTLAIAEPPVESGPAIRTAADLRTQLATVLAAESSGNMADPAALAAAVDMIDEAVHAAVTGRPLPQTQRLRAALGGLHALSPAPESLTKVLRLVRAYARQVAEQELAADDAAGRRQTEDCVHELIVALLQAETRSRFAAASAFATTFGIQHLVSMRLLRSGHEDDPRTLDWLEHTPARAACLGLWLTDPAEPAAAPTLSVAGVFRSGLADPPGTPDRSASSGGIRKGPTRVEAFPPPELISLAEPSCDDMVFVAPMKVNSSDWGLLAIVGPIESTVLTGREIMNQWAALLTIALDHGAVLESLRGQEERLRHAALYDDLTGLPNRALFFDRLLYAIARHRRRADYHFGVFLLDLDGFKIVNDSLGHLTGDRLLIEIARRVQGCVRDTDVAARFGGDEFAVLLDDLASEEGAGVVASRLQLAIAEPVILDEQEIVVSASVGVALSSTGYDQPEEVIRDADIAMYAAKARQKGGHAVFDVAMHTRAVDRLRTEGELRRAVEAGELELHYQPIVELTNGALAGFEALVRWRHPDKGLLAPADFLAIAEESGLMLPIGNWVLTEACRQLGNWYASGLTQQIYLSVNISNRQFWNGQLARGVEAQLRDSGLSPACLAIEITEGIIMHDVKLARRRLEELHELGVELYIDDFGTGYSSLEALHYLPIDALKIDKSFVGPLGQGGRSEELVRAIVAMGTNLGLALIAEGIETEEHRGHLRDLGCSYGQGYLFSRPLPAADALRLINLEPSHHSGSGYRRW